uniref:WD40 repeat domain-containing protein n=1 Tax=Desertifilum tharense IPPAS B-1220 TaxID=1781255 RepID=A0ACD5GWR6_9CYAN
MGVLDNTVKLWSVEGTLLSTLSGHASGVLSVAFSPDGKTLVSGGYDRTAIVWNLEAILKLNLLEYSCNWVGDYLKTTPEISLADRALCNLRPSRTLNRPAE